MPHFFASTLQTPNYPVSADGLEFVDEFTHLGETLIWVKSALEEFFISKRLKRNRILVKYDKVSRIAKNNLLKQAIQTYADITHAEVVTENLTQHKNEKSYEYLQKPEFFTHLPEGFDDVVVEIGFGSGKLLLGNAVANPNTLFIGLEIYKPAIEQVLRQIKLQSIQNIYVVNYDARLFLELLGSNTIARILVHFPVPWDDKPHRRVYNEPFIHEAIRVLSVDGRLELRTDSELYKDYVVGLFETLRLNDSLELRQDEKQEVTSKYESRWLRLGKSIYDVIYHNTQTNPQESCQYDFLFSRTDFAFLDQYPFKAIVSEGVVVHIESIFKSKTRYLIKVTLGSVSRVERKYILIENNIPRYFAQKPVYSSSNIKAHTLLREILSEQNSNSQKPKTSL